MTGPATDVFWRNHESFKYGNYAWLKYDKSTTYRISRTNKVSGTYRQHQFRFLEPGRYNALDILDSDTCNNSSLSESTITSYLTTQDFNSQSSIQLPISKRFSYNNQQSKSSMESNIFGYQTSKVLEKRNGTLVFTTWDLLRSNTPFIAQNGTHQTDILGGGNELTGWTAVGIVLITCLILLLILATILSKRLFSSKRKNFMTILKTDNNEMQEPNDLLEIKV